MVEVGRLSFALDYQGFRRDLQRMERDLEKFQREARNAQGVVGGIGVAGAGRIGTPAPGVAGGRASFAAGAAAGRIGGGFGLGPLAGIAGGLTAVGGLRAMTRASANLELQLAQVQAVTGATAEVMQQLEDAARGAGAATQFTAGEAAGGLLELSRAGLSAQQQLKALRPTLDLATAGLLGMSESADLVTNVAAQFQLPADQIKRIGDVLVGTANRSNTTVAQLGQGLKDVGVIAANLGIPLETVSSALGVLANNGLKGSDGAIKLRNAFVQLLDPSASAQQTLREMGLTIEDVNVQAIGLERVLQNLNRGGLDPRRAASLVNGRNAGALLALSRQGGAALSTLNSQVAAENGAAARQAAAIADTLSGSFKQLGSAAEAFGLALDDATSFTDIMRKAVAGATDALRWMANQVTTGAQSDAPRGFDGPNRQAQMMREGFAGNRAANQAAIDALMEEFRKSGRQNVTLAEMIQREALPRWRERVAQSPNPLGDIPLAPGDTLASRPRFSAQFAANWFGPRPPAGVGRPPEPGSAGPVFGPPAISEQERERVNNISLVTDALEEERKGLMLSRNEREVYYATLAAGSNLRAEEADAIRNQVQELQSLERVGVVADGIGRGIADIGAAWLLAADNAEEATRRILESISQMALQEMALNPLADMLSNFARSFINSFGSTDGNPRSPDVPGQN